MRKKPDKKIVKRIDHLFSLAKKESKRRPDISRRYVALARKLAKHNNLSIKKHKREFCHKCNTYFIPGKNCKIRLLKGKISIKCLKCKSYSRYIIKHK